MAQTSSFVPIDRPAQLTSLASPLRQEILDVLEAAGPCSIADLGERLGRAPDSLYFHMKRLVRVGLIKEVERRKIGRHAFVVYDTIGRPMRIDRAKAKPVHLQSVVTGILRLAARDYRNGLSDARTVGQGAARNHWGARARGWLDDRALARVNELLEELGTTLRGGRPGPGRQPVALTWVLAPVPPRRGAVAPRHNAITLGADTKRNGRASKQRKR